MRLFKASKSLIGIDITSSDVKLLEFRKNRDTYQIESYAIRPLAKDAVVDGRVQNADDVTHALIQALDDARPTTRNAAIALPARMAITKTLTFPLELNEQEIEERLLVESDRLLPFPFTDVAFDFVSLGAMPDAPHLQQVMLVAARHQDLWSWTDVVVRAGLEPVAVDVKTLALARAFGALTLALPSNTGPACAGLVEITLGEEGKAAITLYVLHDGQVIYTQEGGAKCIKATVSDCCFTSLAQQINRALRLYYATEKVPEIAYLVLVGDEASAPGLAAHLAKACGVDVAPGDPLGAMGLSRRLAKRLAPEALADDSTRLMAACGLAMRVAP